MSLNKSEHSERYRSGHNEAVLKTVCPQGRVGSNPTLSVGDISPALMNRIIFGESTFWRSTQVVEGTPLERVQVVNSGARVQIAPSPSVIMNYRFQRLKKVEYEL